MKATFKLQGLVIFMCFSTLMVVLQTASAQTISLKALWTSDSILTTPESVRYNKSENMLYVSCIGSANPTAKDGTGFISLLQPDGTAYNLHWVDGLNAPKGMDIMNGKLYVTDIDHIVIIDIPTASIEKKIEVENSEFLNDVTCDIENNSIYFSDSKTGTVYILQNGKVSVFFKSEATKVLNGLHNSPDYLYLGSDNLLSLNKSTKEIKILVQNTEQIDGLEMINSDVFIGTNWRGRILGLVTQKPLLVLENSDELGYNTADIGINTRKSIIYVPTFFSNTIKAYKYKID